MKRSAENRAVTGKVKSQPKQAMANIRQLMELRVPFARPTPTVEPVMQWVVETGRPSLVAAKTVVRAPSSILKPRLGL